jgi:hypothetical protein
VTLILLNPKGRVASVSAAAIWTVSLILLLAKGDWSIGPILLILLFSLLLALTGVRLYQEFREDGAWLD